MVVSVVYKPEAYDSLYQERNLFYVTLWRPREMEKLADWLKRSPYRDSPVVLTRLHGQSSYLSFYFPESSSRRFIIKHPAEDDIRRVLKSRRPALFITDSHDEIQLTMEKLLGRELKEMLVYKQGVIRVYDISSAVNSMRF